MKTHFFIKIWMLSLPAMSISLMAADVKPSHREVIKPLLNMTFNQNGKARVRKQGGNPRRVDGYLVFDGAVDGNRQVDPQIAVGGGYVLHGTNNGLIIYGILIHYFVIGHLRQASRGWILVRLVRVRSA